MKATAQLWVRLKVIDLVVQTAWITLTETMGFAEDLRGMLRYAWWLFDADGPGAAAVSGAIDREIRMDSAFTNQNKHRYRLAVEAGGERVVTGDLDLDADRPGAGEGVFVCDLLVTGKAGGRDAGWVDRLGPRLGEVHLAGARSGEVWRMLVRADDAASAASKVEEMAVTRSRRHGLLVNPHYQGFALMRTEPAGAGGGKT
ncbi:MAG: hypothetical protein PHQ19_00985 [Candidatus Krumholzibacteria bacterium]|nr:hypothetical protein [Candidatus Krumholzibacteria bacterium]